MTSLPRISTRSRGLLKAVSIAILAFGAAQAAQAALFVPGSTFQVQAGNSPDTFTADVALTPGTTLLDGGALSLTISIVPSGAGSEWLVFSYNTTSGGPLSQPNQNWNLNQVGLDAAVGVNFTAAYSQFSHDGTALAPTSSIFGGYGVEANPVPGATGTGLGVSGFSAPLGSGPLTGLGAFINPWSFLNATGIDSSQVNGYEQALQFAPTVPVPEPASWMMVLAGGAGLAVAMRRRTRTEAATASVQ